MDTAAVAHPDVPKSAARILIVEDERVVALDLSLTLEKLGYAVVGNVISGSEAIECARTERPDLILMDIRLNGEIDGIDTAREIHLFWNCPVIFLTAYSDEQTLQRAKHATPFGYLVKPFKTVELRCTVEVALHKNRVEERLREQDRWFSTTLRSLSDAVIATDPANKIRFLNPSAELLTGWAANDAHGLEVHEILALVRAEVSLPGVTRRHDGASGNPTPPVELQTFFVNKKGQTVEIDDAVAPIVDDDGVLIGQVIVFRDITDLRRSLEEIRQLTVELEWRVGERTAQLQAANGRLLAAARVKSEFLSRMSHELRTPLHSIIGFSKLFLIGKVGELTESQRKYMLLIGESGQVLLSLVNDILDLSMIEAERMMLEFEPVDVLAELHACLQGVAEQVQRRKIAVRIDAPPSIRRLLADRRKFQQIVFNLLSNALKFTDDGGTVLFTAREVARAAVAIDAPMAGSARLLPLPQHDFQTFLRIEVVDDGIGIADLDEIFQAFAHIDSSLASERRGAGLGMAIVKQLAELHGGTVAVSSAAGRGATFVVWLPIREQAGAAAGGARA